MINLQELICKTKHMLLWLHPKLRYRYYKFPPSDVKECSEQYLSEKGLKICEWLPWKEHVTNIRTNNEIARRAAACLGLFNIYLGGPTDHIKKWLEENNLFGSLSEEEALLLSLENEKINEKDLIKLGWLVESLYALMWFGNIMDELNPEKHVPDTLVNFLPNIEKNESAATFIKQFKSRSYDALYQMLDLHYRVHNHTRQCWLDNVNSPYFDNSVIHCRRQALEWIFDISSDWDNVDLST
jgi:hypothetical protein